MGILSDPEAGSSKWVTLLVKINRPLCFACCLIGLAMFLLLAHKPFNNKNYFSENALLPGLVRSDFLDDGSAKQLFLELQDELQEKYEFSTDIPVPWLVGKMSQLNMEVYTHNFTLNYPLGKGQKFTGTNVYGILRAPRTSSVEALVLSAPFRALTSHHKQSLAGIALMLSFAKFARPQKYWAKDIIFLITEHEQLGMAAWLEAYHGISKEHETFESSLGYFNTAILPEWIGQSLENLTMGSLHNCLDSGKLLGRSGAIQAAINLEIPQPNIKYIEVKVSGLNGQLPNLDLFNLVNKMCIKSSVHHSFYSSYSWISVKNNYQEWRTSFDTMYGMMVTQFSGVPNGNHGLFHRFRIEAVTLEGRDASDPGPVPRVHALTSASFARLSAVLEGTLRSLNNLLERFHQSFFFYLLVGTERFVSIGQYMPCLCLFCAALLIRSLGLWIQMQRNETDRPAKKEKKDRRHRKKTKRVKDVQEGGDLIENANDDEVISGSEMSEYVTDAEETLKEDNKEVAEDKRSNVATDFSLVNIGANFMSVHFFGYLLMRSPPLFAYIGTQILGWPTDESIYTFLTLSSFFLMFFSLQTHKILRESTLSLDEMTFLNMAALVELSAVLMAVSMNNFALGFALALVYVPFALSINPMVKKEENIFSRTFFTIRSALCVLIHPLVLPTCVLVVYTYYLGLGDNYRDTIMRGVRATKDTFTFAVVDEMIYGNWLFNVVTACLVPIWTLFWQVLNCRVDKREENNI